MFKRYTLTDVTSNQFYQMPKFLFEGELKNSLSNDAKVLYSLLRDRHDLSIANRWVDKNNDVYIIYTRSEMGEMLGCSKQKIVNLCNELKKNNLFDEERQGLNKPNLIYLNYLEHEINNPHPNKEPKVQTNTENLQQTPSNKEVPKLDFQKSNNHTSRSLENRPQEVPILDANKTNRTQTDVRDTEYQSIYPQEQKNDETIDTIEIIEIVKENIGYDICKQTKGEEEYIDNILSVMVDVICSTSPTVRVGKQDKAQSIVKSTFLKLTHDHIEYVCQCLSDSTSKINSIRSYLITALYNAPQTMDTYYSQRVKHDMTIKN